MEDHNKWDFELLDRYQSFSSELLRISILSIGGFGYLLGLDHGSGQRFAQVLVLGDATRSLTKSGLISLVIASTSSLAHRYFSSDSMHYLSLKRRRGLNSQENKTKDKLLYLSSIFITIASITLALGVALLSIAFIIVWRDLSVPHA